jgi:hypothetical protein
MTITAKIKPTGRSGTYAGVIDDHETVVYLVETDDKYITRYDIMAAGVLPIKYQLHPENSLMTVRSVDLAQTDGPMVWEATIEYSSVPYDQTDEDDEDTLPTQQAARIKWTTTQFTKPLTRDVDGNAIINSAGDYFDPPIEIDTSRWSIVIEKKVAAVPSYILSYANTINEAAITIDGVVIGEKVAKLSEISISEKDTAQGEEFYTFTYRLELANADEGDWVVKVLDQGLHEFDRAERKTPILVDGEPAKQPVLLDGNGIAIVDPEPTDAVFLEFDGYVEADFSVLPLT